MAQRSPNFHALDPGLIEHSTESHHDRNKVDFWADLVCQHLVPVECQSVAEPENFHGSMALRQMGRISVIQIVAGGLQVARTACLLARASTEHFLVGIQEAGHGYLAQHGRVAKLQPGDMAVCSSADAFRLSFADDFARTVLAVPADELRLLVPDVDRLTARALDGQGAAVRLFGQVTHHYFETDSNALPSEAVNHAANGLLQILAGTLLSHRTEGPAERPRLERFHIARIKQYVMETLKSPALSVASASAALHISPTHIHRLFATESQSFSEWLWSCRLLACKQQLDDQSQAHRNITEIALDNGFSNSAHFSRSFRAKFGVSPRECRATQRDGQPHVTGRRACGSSQRK